MAHKYYKHTIAKGADVNAAVADLGTEGVIVRTETTATGETHVYFASHSAPKKGTEVKEADVTRIG
jgi:hypothetical protein